MSSRPQPAATPEEIAARRALSRSTKPIPCYAVDQIPPKKGSDALYQSLATLVPGGKATLSERLEIPARDAKSWVVKAGQLFRIICSHGPQVADMNCWSLENPKEHFYSSKTRQIHATHLTTGDRLWSNMPYVRPLATIVHDSIAYGWDEDGAGVHDVIGRYVIVTLYYVDVVYCGLWWCCAVNCPICPQTQIFDDPIGQAAVIHIPIF